MCVGFFHAQKNTSRKHPHITCDDLTSSQSHPTRRVASSVFCVSTSKEVTKAIWMDMFRIEAGSRLIEFLVSLPFQVFIIARALSAFFFFIISRSRLKFRNRFDGGGAYTVFCYSMIFFFAISLALQCAICLWNCAIRFGNFPSQRGVGLVSNPHASTLPFHIDFYCAATRYLGFSFTKLQFEISTIFLSFRKTFHLSPTQNSVISQRPGMLSKLSRDSVTDCASLS